MFVCVCMPAHAHVLVMCTDHEKGSQDLKAEREQREGIRYMWHKGRSD